MTTFYIDINIPEKFRDISIFNQTEKQGIKDIFLKRSFFQTTLKIYDTNKTVDKHIDITRSLHFSDSIDCGMKIIRGRRYMLFVIPSFSEYGWVKQL